MNELQFLETIKVVDGVFYNLPLHKERMQKTAGHFFKTTVDLNVSINDIPYQLRTGLVKCRVIYNSLILSIEFEPYSFRHIGSLKVVDGNTIDYNYKSTDRTQLAHLLAKKETADDILIIKNDLITDTSYANVVFEDSAGLYTPNTFLLNGTKRQLLLQSGIIKERKICLQDIANYHKIYLINAMIDIADAVFADINKIIY